MIYTCTLNPSIDYVVQVANFQPGKINRTDGTQIFPGGKGINVSRVLHQLGVESTAIGFIGGFTGEFIKQFLANESIRTDFIDVNDTTRINIKLKSVLETEINGKGPSITKGQQEKLLKKIDSLQQGDYLVLAGSIPPSLPSNIYQIMAEKCEKIGIHFIVDTTGSALTDTFSAKPFLIKPNHHELGELYDTDIKTAEEAIFYGKKLIAKGVQNVIVSMAGDGAVFVNADHSYVANVPKGTVKNSVGAGDSVVAGFLAAMVQKRSFEEAFQYGVASGSATAFSVDLCTKGFVEQLLPEIMIKNFS